MFGCAQASFSFYSPSSIATADSPFAHRVTVITMTLNATTLAHIFKCFRNVRILAASMTQTVQNPRFRRRILPIRRDPTGADMPANQFSSAREAKEFLVSGIVEEAQRESVPLSEVERKMLYFTETGWTLPGMIDVSNEFDSDYDQSDYEKKIASLIKNKMKWDRKENSQYVDSWMNAVRKLSKEDHYILVMIGQAGVSARPPGDTFRLLGSAMVIVAVVLGLSWASAEYNIDFGKYFPSWDTMSFGRVLLASRSPIFWEVSCLERKE